MRNRLVKAIGSVILLAALVASLDFGLTQAFEGTSKSDIGRLKSLSASGQGNRWIHLQDGIELPTVYVGATGLTQVLERGLAQPLALASGDFNEDGVPDLVGGYIGPGGGILTVHRGNVEALWPQQRRREGGKERGGDEETGSSSRSVPPSLPRSVSPFLEEARVFELPEAPDFLGAGDFDADGHLDVVAAAKGSEALHWLRGDGRGEFGAVNEIKLSGTVTAMTAGEINRRDGLTDVVIGVTGPEGPRVLVFQSPAGAMANGAQAFQPAQSAEETQTRKSALPQGFSVPGEVTALELGQFDDSYEMDLAVATDHGPLLIHGRDRTTADFGSDISDLRLKKSDGSSIFNPPSAIGHPPSVVAVLPMRLNVDGASDLVILKKGSSAPTVVLTAPMATFTVNSTADDDDGACAAAPGDCTLREAINAANAGAGADMIQFSLGPGTPTIVADSLPGITEQVTILGNTGGATRVVLQGDGSGSGNGLAIEGGSGTVVQSLQIVNFDFFGIELTGTSNGTRVEGCYIGTDGVNGFGNGFGGVSINNSPDNTIGGTTAAARNVISGNEEGVSIAGDSATGNTVAGNYIGTDETGADSLENESVGLSIHSLASNNTIGGTGAGAGNVISGNRGDGVYLQSTTGQLIQGNSIGLDVSGTVTVANHGHGVSILDADSNTIGGTTAAARNIISGFSPTGKGGVLISQSFGSATENLVQGNYIGTDASGAVAMLDSAFGVSISGGSNNTIGGATAGAGNLISGTRGDGVILAGAGNTVAGNTIGTNPTGASGLGNLGNGVVISGANNVIGGTMFSELNVISGNNLDGVLISGAGAIGNHVQGNFIGVVWGGLLGNGGHGVHLTAPAHDNAIGGTTNGFESNIIVSNGGDGVFVQSGTGNAIRGNQISNNGGLGIDLDEDGDADTDDGVTPNDSGDSDTGTNNLQNFPVLTSISADDSITAIHGTLNSTPNTTFTLDFYSNGCDPSGFGEGVNFLGSGSATTDGSGSVNFLIFLPSGIVDAGDTVTATATDPFDNTSEFSGCEDVVGPEPPVARCKNVTVTAGAACAVPASIDNGSFDPDGGPVTLSQSPPGPYPPGMTMVTLTVTDNEGDMSQCTATVTVTNSTPTANAGPDQTSDESTLVMLNGAASADPDPSQSPSFQWTQVGGPSVVLSGAATATASFTSPDVPEGSCLVMLTFQLKVTDPCGAMATDTVVVTVSDVLILQDDRNGNCLALDCCAGTYRFKVGRSWFTAQAIITKSPTKITFQSAPSDPNYLTGSVDLVMRRASVRLQAPRGGPTIHNIYDGNIDNNGPCQ